MKKKQTLGLCVIVKDEEKNIARCIGSVSGIADEIVVVDTGSTDNTVEIARALGAAVYYYPWDNSFSNARNFAMEKAKSDWLLLLDADEALEDGAGDKVLEFVYTTALDGAHFRVRNYTGVYTPDNYNLHSALRLLRNNGMYRFKGNIHEQIISEGRENLYDRFATLDVVLHHYGYLDEAVREKQKRGRNIPILEKMLEENSGDAFTLFNLGNEYLSANHYERALAYYLLAKDHVKAANLAFVPHLYFRMINCYEALGQFDKALSLIAEGLVLYPGCTDYEHIRANIHLRSKRYTLAIDSLQKCLKMGEPPAPLEFISGCGTFRSSFLLGEIYCQLEDNFKALEYYKMTLNFKPDMLVALYRAGYALKRITPDKEEVRGILFSCFADPSYPPNVIVGADILIGEGLYDEALRALEAISDSSDDEAEVKYLTARAMILLGRYEMACPLLGGVLESERQTRILPGIQASGALLYFTAGLSAGDSEVAKRGLGLTERFCGRHGHDACRLLYQIFLDEAPEALSFENDGEAEMETLLLIYDNLLRQKQFELFEKLLRALNYIDCKSLLLRVAYLFWKNDFRELAADYVRRSVRELGTLDEFGAMILFRMITNAPPIPRGETADGSLNFE